MSRPLNKTLIIIFVIIFLGGSSFIAYRFISDQSKKNAENLQKTQILQIQEKINTYEAEKDKLINLQNKLEQAKTNKAILASIQDELINIVGQDLAQKVIDGDPVFFDEAYLCLSNDISRYDTLIQDEKNKLTQMQKK